MKHTANGLRFGFIFIRPAGFKVPTSVLIKGRGRITLSFPVEYGVGSDFMTCLVSNEYGLGRGMGRVSTILDIGANVGFFSIAAKSYYPDAIIHGYEPNPRVLPFLLDNMSHFEDCRVFNEAVGSVTGLVNMLDSGDSNQARTLPSSTGTIKQTSFAEAVARLGGSVDLVKIDCEGAEWDLFQGGKCWNRIKHIRMEYHLGEGYSFEDVPQSLAKLGFKITSLKRNVTFGTVFAERRDELDLITG